MQCHVSLTALWCVIHVTIVVSHCKIPAVGIIVTDYRERGARPVPDGTNYGEIRCL